LAAEGRTNLEIGDALALSVRTVERHLSNDYLKLDVSGKAARAAAVARVVAHAGAAPGTNAIRVAFDIKSVQA
jgi:DNA-binding CsgD family transcriptional regulator